MTSNYSARIAVDAGDATRAIYESIQADDAFYPGNPVGTRIELDGGELRITAESSHLPHLRANLNSTLRLIRASYGAIGSAKRSCLGADS